MRQGVLDQLQHLPAELTDAMLDIAAQSHGPIEMHGENYDVVAVAAKGILGHSDSAHQFAPLMEAALMRKAPLSASSSHYNQVVTPQPGQPAPLLTKRLFQARHIIIRVNLQATASTGTNAVIHGMQQASLQDVVALVRALSDTRRAELCPRLESICVQPCVSTSNRDPNTAFADAETAFDAAQALDSRRLRPILQHITSALQADVPGVPIARSIQLRARAFWADGVGSTVYECKQVKVQGQEVDDVLRVAQQDPVQMP